MNKKTKIKTFYNNYLSSSLLFLKNLLFTKKLIVKNFLYTNKIIIKGNETELNWETTGCYKILIRDLGILPGDTSHIRLTLEKKINSVEIIFYGVRGQKEIKTIEIKTNSPSVLNKFTLNINISNLNSIPLNRQNLKKILINSPRYNRPNSVKLKEPKIKPQNLKINFEQFIKSNYLIKS